MSIRTFSRHSSFLTVFLALGGCDESSDPQGDGSSSDSSADGVADDGVLPDTPIVGYPTLVEACDAPVDEPTHLVVSATDDDTGAIGWVDVATKSVTPDLALAQTDIGMSYDGRHVYVLNRHMFDYVDILDPHASLALVSEFSVSLSPEVSSNPHDLIVDAQGEAYVSLFGASTMSVFDVSDPAAVQPLRQVSMAPFADADGVPEMSMFVRCGDTAFLSVERLDDDWSPVDRTYLVPFDLVSDRFYDFSVDPELDAVPLLGIGANGYRLDPRDPSGHTVLLLNNGLQAVNLATGTTSWVIDAATFEQMGIGRYQLRGFDIAANGELYFVIATADFSAHGLHRASLTGGGADLTQLVGDIQTTTGAIEVIGREAWVADTTIGASGLRVFNLDDPAGVAASSTVLPTGLPPYGILPLP